MARRKKARTLNMSKTTSDFAVDVEHAFKITEAEIVDGNKSEQIKLQLEGMEDSKGSSQADWLSLSEAAAFRIRQLADCVNYEYDPDDLENFDIDEFVSELPGMTGVLTTHLDTGGDQPRIRVARYLKHDGDVIGEDEDIDLNEVDDEDIFALAKKLKIKGKKASKLRELIEEEDEDDVIAAAEKLDIDLTGASSGDSDDITAESIGEMNEEELQELVDDHDLKVKLKKLKTLRKKKEAVIDAMEEAGNLAD